LRNGKKEVKKNIVRCQPDFFAVLNHNANKSFATSLGFSLLYSDNNGNISILFLKRNLVQILDREVTTN
jgi:hypothetical protein